VTIRDVDLVVVVVAHHRVSNPFFSTLCAIHYERGRSRRPPRLLIAVRLARGGGFTDLIYRLLYVYTMLPFGSCWNTCMCTKNGWSNVMWFVYLASVFFKVVSYRSPSAVCAIHARHYKCVISSSRVRRMLFFLSGCFVLAAGNGINTIGASCNEARDCLRSARMLKITSLLYVRHRHLENGA